MNPVLLRIWDKNADVQDRGEILYDIPYMWTQKKKRKKIQMDLFPLQNRKRFTDLENKLMLPEGRDSWGAWGGHVHTNVFKMDNQQGAIL